MKRIFSGGRNERITETAKIITERRMNILMLSYMKKLTASAKRVLGVIAKKENVSQSANSFIG